MAHARHDAWESAYHAALGGDFEADRRAEGPGYAVAMLRRRLGFLCLSEAEIDSAVETVLDAAGIAHVPGGAFLAPDNDLQAAA